MYQYYPEGVCSRQILFDVEDHKVKDVRFIGGCDGNAKGLAALVEGMDVDDVMERLSGIHCGPQPTSCPDQLAKSLQAYKDQEASGKQDG